MRSPLTPTIKRVEEMIKYVRENLNEVEYDLFLDLLAPEPEVVKPASKAEKKPATKPREYDSCLRCGTTKRDSSHKDQSSPDYHEFQSSKKSAHAQSLSSAIQRAPKGKVGDDVTVGGFADDADMIRCSDCGADSDDNVHHKRSNENYHPFVSASDVDSAGRRSSANGAGSSTTVNSEEQTVSAVNVAGGSNER